jgi:uncharacterized protein with PIN domain
MLSAVPLLYRWIAIGLLLAAFGGWCFVKGLNWSRAEHEAFVSKVETEGRVAQERAAERTREAQRLTKEVSDGYAETIVAVRADYDRRLRDAYTRAGRLPDATPSAPKPHEFREPGSIPDLALRDKIASLEIEIAEIEKRLAEAAVQIEAWKDYGRKVQEWTTSLSAK